MPKFICSLLLINVIVLFYNSSLGQTTQNLGSILDQPTDSFDVPLASVSDLKYLIKLNSSEHRDDSLIIIYSFTGCKPCLALAKKVNVEILDGNIDSKKIIYINLFVLDTGQLLQSLNKGKYKFAYYKTKWPINLCAGQMFPIVSKYGLEGKYVESEGGFDWGTVKRMKEFLNE